MPNKKKRLFIVGAGDLGREMESILNSVPDDEKDWAIEGYLDDREETRENWNKHLSDYKVVGNWREFPFKDGDQCVLAVGESEYRKMLFETMKDRVGFFTYIDKTAGIGRFSDIGNGCFICRNCTLAPGVRLGDGVFINEATTIGHDSVVGPFASLMSQIAVGGYVEIGAEAYVGSNATIIPKMKIGERAMVGAGSVVIRNVQPGTQVFGNPAKRYK